MPRPPEHDDSRPVVQLVPGLGIGGAERVATLLALGLAERGRAVEVVALGSQTGSAFEAQLSQAGIATHFLGKGPGFEISMLPSLRRLLRRLRPAVVHSHLHTLKYLLPTLPARHRPAVVHTVHNLAEREAVAHDRIVQQLAFRMGVVPVAIGAAVADSIQAVYGLAAGATIENGIPVSDYRSPPRGRSALRQELGLSEQALVVVCVGRLGAQKDHATLLSAWADPRFADAHLLLVGDGDLRPALEAQIRGGGMQDRVRLLGVRNDVPDLLAAGDLVVLSSRWEGYPLVVMEALAAGRPVVATRVGCMGELLDDATGRLVDAGDTGGLADALAELLEGADLRRAMGAAAAQQAQQRFDVSVMLDRYQALYASLRSRG